MTRRDDIQALRAFAVIAVILFHLGIKGFSGGFVGVDIFFVISGYLITKKIATEMASGRFTFAGFSIGRARRLLPALLTTIAVTFVAGAFILTPEDFQSLAGSTVFAVFGLSNFFFWYEAGYFDSAAILKPLLHTWSLAVEIQFYILWPFAIALLVRTRRYLPGLAAIAALSFAATLWAMKADQTMAFFWTPFRIFEFAAGGLVFALEHRAPRNRAANDAIYLLGLSGAAASVLLYTEITPFPGWFALPPVAGTALMIFAGRSRIATAVSIKPLSFLGEISYSLYLVHWPLIVYAHYRLGDQWGWTAQAVLIPVILAAALLLYFCVEAPFRRRSGRASVSARTLAYGCAALMLFSAAPAAHAWATEGWLWRYGDDSVAFYNVDRARKYVWQQHNVLQRVPSFTSTKPRILIVGDSQSADFVNVLYEAGIASRYEIITRAVITDCGVPYVKPEREKEYFEQLNPFIMKGPHTAAECKAQMQRFLTSAPLKQADLIVLAFIWRDYSVRFLPDAIDKIKTISSAPIFIVGGKGLNRAVGEIYTSAKSIKAFEAAAGRSLHPETKPLNAELAKRFGDHFIDLMAVICPAPDRCNMVTPQRGFVYFGASHFTKDGAAMVGRLLGDPFVSATAKSGT